MARTNIVAGRGEKYSLRGVKLGDRTHLTPTRCALCTGAFVAIAGLASSLCLADDANNLPPLPVATEPVALFDVPQKMGGWYVVPMPRLGDRMQAVHAALLPSGKVLMASGSSFRVRLVGENKYKEPMNGRLRVVVDNTGIFDPTLADPQHPGAQSFHRIPSPITPIADDGKEALAEDHAGDVNDLFCSGHLHTPEGDVLFAGGNLLNYPGMTFAGARVANLFRWQTEKWEFAGKLKDGHWYPTLLELPDGRIEVVSGLVSQPGPGNVTFNSSKVEFYDWRKGYQDAWTCVDIRELPHSPFNEPTGAAQTRDAMDHYPRMFLLPDGRQFITGDGSAGGDANSRKTYLMTVSAFPAAGGPPPITFTTGIDRPSPRRIYGSALIDPNSPVGDILMFGGQLGSERSTIGPFLPPTNRPLAVSRNMERYRPPDGANPGGRWEVTLDFLGSRFDDQRTMHIALTLPTKQILIIGGGNFAFYRPIFSPLLCTPDASKPGGYRTEVMNPGTQPRLYHTTALLLPDARVLLAGGNAARASLNVETGDVDLMMQRNPLNNSFTAWEKGTYQIPDEIHRLEIFSPPYLFIDGPRPSIEEAPETIGYGKEFTATVKGATEQASVVLVKLGSVTHGWDAGQKLVDLKFAQAADGTLTATAPGAPVLAPPGYYMLFYVNQQGQPSVAKMVKLALP